MEDEKFTSVFRTVSILSRMNPVYNRNPFSFEIHLNIILKSTQNVLQWFFP